MAYMRLGDLLISAGVIRPEQLNEALAIQKKTRERLGDVLINNGIITEQQLIEALQMQLGVDFVDLTAVSIPLELARFVPRSIAKKYCVVPVKLQKDELYVAMSDPLNFEAQEEIKSASRKHIHAYVHSILFSFVDSKGRKPVSAVLCYDTGSNLGI